MPETRGVLDLLKHPWARVVLEAIGIVACFWLITRLSDVLTPVLVGLILAYILDPVVTWLTRHGCRRQFAVTVIFGGAFLALCAALALGIPKAWHGGRDFYLGAVYGDQWEDANGDRVWQPGEPLKRDLNGNGVADPPYLRRLTHVLVDHGVISGTVKDEAAADVPQGVGSEVDSLEFDPLSAVKDSVKHMVAAYRSGDHRAFEKIKGIGAGLGFWLLAIVLVPVYGFFFSLNLPLVSRTIMEHVPLRHRDRTLHILAEINVAVGAFFRGRLVICLILGILAGIGFAIARVPSWPLLAILMGIGTAIPLAAGLTVIPVFVLLYLGGGDTWQYITVAGTYLVVQGLEPVLIAVIMGAGVEIHPVILIVAIFGFGALFGAPGVLLAVPLAATARILLREFLYPQMRRMASLDANGPPAPPAPPA
jgi:predicted PurR-regulated permease PerM